MSDDGIGCSGNCLFKSKLRATSFLLRKLFLFSDIAVGSNIFALKGLMKQNRKIKREKTTTTTHSPLHLFRTSPHGKSGLPSISLTLLCISHSHWLRVHLLVKSGGLYSISDRKCSAHGLQGYKKENASMKVDICFCSVLSGLDG